MKAFCENCNATQPAEFRKGKDAKTGEDYEDLCCNECNYIVATVQDRVVENPAERE